MSLIPGLWNNMMISYYNVSFIAIRIPAGICIFKRSHEYLRKSCCICSGIHHHCKEQCSKEDVNLSYNIFSNAIPDTPLNNAHIFHRYSHVSRPKYHIPAMAGSSFYPEYILSSQSFLFLYVHPLSSEKFPVYQR